VELGKTPTMSFNILLNMRYHYIKVASDEVTFQPSTIGVGNSLKTIQQFFIEEECMMLAQVMCYPHFHLV
jgi:hypothetical protein